MESFEQNLRYAGQYFDNETGLHFNTFRFYDPQIGRFIMPDPIGLLGRINLYQYAVNLMELIDPLD
ncbi:RHS repeat-associated core domain protein [Providencia stuartii]|nr:RHS repeat-associated core domain-containing protein [Providencia stuartii]AIN63569.1 RHS repeat-associated core domain protein [Providencia stuartii]